MDFSCETPPLHKLARLYAHCNQRDTRFRLCVAGALNTFLYEKYSSSQSYFYTRAINQITTEARTPVVFLYNEMVAMLRPEQFGKRFYTRLDAGAKLELLAEYYKYHEDVPRLFMQGLAAAIHNFYDKKRRINYIRITKMLKGRVDPKVRIHDSETSSMLNGSVASSLLQFLPGNSVLGGRAALSRSTTILDLQDVFEKAFETAPPAQKPRLHPPHFSEASPVIGRRPKAAISRPPVELKSLFTKQRLLDINSSHQTRTLPHNQRGGPLGSKAVLGVADSHRAVSKVGRVDFGHMRSAKFKKFIQQERTLHSGNREAATRVQPPSQPRNHCEEQPTVNVRRVSQCPARPFRESDRQHNSLRRLMLKKSASKPIFVSSTQDISRKKLARANAQIRSPGAIFQTKRSTYDELFNTHKQNFRTFATGPTHQESLPCFGTLGVQSLFSKKRSLHDGPIRAKLEQSIKQKISSKNTQLQLNLLERTVSNSRAKAGGDTRGYPPRSH